MSIEDRQVGVVYEVVLNDEGQYSIWAADQAIPSGWRAVGQKGDKEHCLAHIEKVWVDMRPLSLIKQINIL